MLSEPGVALAAFTGAVLGSLLAVPFWHAPALVHWGGQGVAQALFSSTLALWRNKAAFVVNMLLWAGLLMAVTSLVTLVFSLVGLAQAAPIVLMATGNTPIMDFSLFDGMRTLSANVAVEMGEAEVGSTHFRVLFLSALVLLSFTFVMNTLAELIRQRLRKKYASL